MDQLDLENAFKYHAPIEGQTERYERIRELGKELAFYINDSAPDSREKSLSITKIREAVMWANAAIAVNEK